MITPIRPISLIRPWERRSPDLPLPSIRSIRSTPSTSPTQEIPMRYTLPPTRSRSIPPPLLLGFLRGLAFFLAVYAGSWILMNLILIPLTNWLKGL